MYLPKKTDEKIHYTSKLFTCSKYFFLCISLSIAYLYNSYDLKTGDTSSLLTLPSINS